MYIFCLVQVENSLEETLKKLHGGDEEETVIEETPKEEEKAPEPEKAPVSSNHDCE